MLSINSVLLPNGKLEDRVSDVNLLVVYACPRRHQLFLLELDPERKRYPKPKPYPFDEINSWIDEGLVSIAELSFPEHLMLEDDDISVSRRKNRDERYGIIEPIINSIEAYYAPKYGQSIVKKRADELSITSLKIQRLIYMWLAGGQTKNALLGDYSKVGIAAPGENAKKTGSKRKNSPFTGKILSKEDKKNIEKYLNKYVLKKRSENQLSLSKCFKKLLQEQYADKSVNKFGDITIKNWHPDKRPSNNQFYDYAKSYFNRTNRYPAQFKVKSTVYLKDYAGRSGTVLIPTRPGQVYQIDETPFDAALIAEFFSETGHRVGRATLYVVLDVYSCLIVGIHITFRNPCWETMRQALLNAFLPKVEFCKRYGIHIEDDEWPHGVCSELLGDNAELLYGKSATLEQHFNCSVKLARKARGDDKGNVENSFNVLKTELQGLAPGLVYKDENDQGLTESKYRATLTIKELYKILILIILDRNKYGELLPDNLDIDTARDDVIPRPLDMWRWGCRERGGPKYFTLEFIEKHLKSTGVASVHKNGVYFNSLMYNCEWTLATGLQDRKPSGNTSLEIDCLYDDNCVDVITLVKDGHTYPAYLQERSRRFKGCTVHEFERRRKQEDYELNSREPERTSATSTTNARIEKVVKGAISRSPKLSKSDIKRQKVRENRAIVAQMETDSLAAAARKKQRPDLQNEPQEKPSRSSKKTTKTPRSKSDSGVNRALDDLMGENDND
jgi:hypothetical protein